LLAYYSTTEPTRRELLVKHVRWSRLSLALAIASIGAATVPVAALAPASGPAGAPGFRSGTTQLVSVDSRGRPATAAPQTGPNADTTFAADHLNACWFSSSQGSALSNTLINTGPDISADGRYVVFVSDAALVADDTNRACDAYEYDRVTRHLTRVSVSSSGGQATPSIATGVASTSYASVSADGRYVAFASDASGLVPASATNPLAWNVYVHDTKTGKTVNASVSSAGLPGKTSGPTLYGSYMPRISGDGRYVVFASQAEGLVPNDPTPLGTEQLYRHDLRTGQTLLVPDGKGCDWPTMNATGQFVAFSCGSRVYVSDLRAGHTRLAVDATPAGVGSSCRAICDTYVGSIGGSALSADGRFLVFISEATALVPNKHNSNICSAPGARDSADDVFVADLRTNRIQRVSVSSAGEEAQWGGGGGDASCWQGGGGINNGGAISANGRYVTFRSMTNFFAQDTGYTTALNGFLGGPAASTCTPTTAQACPGDPDAYVYDTLTGSLDWISTTPDRREATGSWCRTYGSPPDGHNGQSAPVDSASYGAAVSRDGRFAVFTSCTTDLVPNDHTNQWEVYLRDRGLVLGAGGLAASGRLTVAGRPGFAHTGVVSVAAVPGAGSGIDVAGGALAGTTVAYRAKSQDLFVREALQSMPAVGPVPAAGSALLYGLAVTANGAHYEVRVQHVLGPDYDAAGGASFGLFRETSAGSWTKVATLRGGYGTTGQEVVFSLPLAAIGAQIGARLSGLTAFTAVGSYFTGPTEILDHVRLSQ
jgi:hypothetical protein